MWVVVSPGVYNQKCWVLGQQDGEIRHKDAEPHALTESYEAEYSLNPFCEEVAYNLRRTYSWRFD